MFKTLKNALALQRSKKGESSVLNFIIGLGVGLFAIAALVIGTQSFRDGQTVNSSAYNFTNNMLSMFTNTGSQLPTVGTMVGVALILAVIGGGIFLALRGQSR